MVSKKFIEIHKLKINNYRSIGCILYELCTFQHPFIGDKVLEVFDAIVKEEPPSIINLYSTDLNKIVKKTLKKNPSDRPSAADLLSEPLILTQIKDTIKRTLINAEDSEKIYRLVNSLAELKLNEDDFSDFENKGTI